MDKCSERLIGLFPKTTYSYLARAGVQAYEVAYEMMKRSGFYGLERGKETLPIIRNLALDFQLIELAKTGAIPFKCEEEHNVAKNSHHVVLTNNEAIVTVSQVKRPEEFPRNAVYRGDYAENNAAMSLFEEYEPDRNSEKIYVLLTHGGIGSTMYFARLGIPQTGARRWVGNQLAIFDRSSLVGISLPDMIDVKPIKPSLKKFEDFVEARTSGKS